MPPAGSVSVIICTHDAGRFALLERAVESVRAQDPPPHELIVVVDHNATLADRVAQRFPGLTVVANREAQGLSGARNSGVLVASGEIVAFMDDDAAADRGWVAALAATYEDPATLGAGGTIMPDWATSQPPWFPDEFLWVVGCSYRGLPERRRAVRNLIGCNMSFRRSMFTSVGGFLHGMGRGRGLPLGCEETELCIRSARMLPGTSFVYEPAAVVHHVVPLQRARIGYFLLRCFSEGISKASIVKLLGASEGMASERSYLTRTLTTGVGHNLARLLRGSGDGALKSVMIPAGLVAFAVGYARAMLRFALRGSPERITSPVLIDK